MRGVVTRLLSEAECHLFNHHNYDDDDNDDV